MTYTEIFGEIVSIMQKDSASYPDFGAGDYEKYLEKITDDMDRMEYLHLVQDYLATFGIFAHLGFGDNRCGGVGFSVMKNGDALYVTSANKGTGLVKGDKITAVDSLPLEEIAQREKNMLMGESDERQGVLWPSALKFHKTLTVQHEDGSQEEIGIKLGTEADPEEKYSYKSYGDDTLYLRFADFADPQAISKLYEACKDSLDKCKNLIVDVRGNGGGVDACFIPLLEYSFPAGDPIEKYIKIEYSIEINYSERNCDDRLQLLKSYVGEDVPEDMAKEIEKMLSDLEENKGKGFIDEKDGMPAGIMGKAIADRIFVLTDEGCGSSGDAFVELMSFSPKVTVVGRPTAGITDYSNLNMVNFDDFMLAYPTSRDKRIDHGKGLLHKGVPVDEYIPWTPEQIKKDVVLEYVLEQIK